MSDLKIVEMQTENGPNVIERLEQALEHARNGGINNCLVTLVHKDGSVVDCWANGNDPFVMIGAIESIKREFMDSCIENRDD